MRADTHIARPWRTVAQPRQHGRNQRQQRRRTGVIGHQMARRFFGLVNGEGTIVVMMMRLTLPVQCGVPGVRQCIDRGADTCKRRGLPQHGNQNGK